MQLLRQYLLPQQFGRYACNIYCQIYGRVCGIAWHPCKITTVGFYLHVCISTLAHHPVDHSESYQYTSLIKKSNSTTTPITHRHAPSLPPTAPSTNNRTTNNKKTTTNNHTNPLENMGNPAVSYAYADIDQPYHT